MFECVLLGGDRKQWVVLYVPWWHFNNCRSTWWQMI